MKKLLLTFATVAIAVASEASYRITLFQPSYIGGTELKPGDYKVQLRDNKAVIKTSKETLEVPVKVESGDQKFSATTVRYMNEDGKLKINEIRVGGSNTKLVFEPGAAAITQAR